MCTIQLRDPDTKAVIEVFQGIPMDRVEASLWALRRCRPLLCAVCFLPGAVEPIDNWYLKGQPPKDIEHLIEAMELQFDNKSSIEALVGLALGSVFDDLRRFGDDPEYVSKIVQSAEEWARECYQVPIMEH